MTGSRNPNGKDSVIAYIAREREADRAGEVPRNVVWHGEVGESAVGHVKSADSVANGRRKNRRNRRGAKPSVGSVIAHPVVVEERKKDVNASNVLPEVSQETTAEQNGDAEEKKMEEQNGNTEIWGSADGWEEYLVKRLQTIVKACERPTISHPELESNLQEQADEILALESIYGEDFKRINIKEIESPSFMISVNVGIPANLILAAELRSTPNSGTLNEPQGSASTSDRPTTSTSSELDPKHCFTVQNLPPIQFVLTLPSSYPSHSPPLFVLYVSWLNSERLSKLCTSLDTIWDNEQGQVVLYQLIDWLQTQSLPLLGIAARLELGPYQVGGTICNDKESDIRAVSGCCSFDSDIARLLHYNDEQKIDKFRKSFHTCNICFTEQLGKDFAKLACEHMFCWSCMQTYASVQVKEGSVNNLNCPDTICRHSISPFILKQLLDEEAFEKWDKLVLQKSLDGMEDIVYCPRCERVCIEEENNFVQCGGCFFSFCSLCKQSWHVGQECVSPEARLEILQGRQKEGSGEEQRKKEKEMINELMNLQYVRREAKQCPKCKMAISKTEGCNKMTCTNCGQYFCFRCAKAIEGYDHFRDGSCQLFEADIIQAWQPQMNIQQQQAQIEIELELWPELARICPNCRQRNTKNGNNNHIYCWACRSSFCSLCNKVVRRTSEHFGFGPNKCRQHTVD